MYTYMWPFRMLDRSSLAPLPHRIIIRRRLVGYHLRQNKCRTSICRECPMKSGVEDVADSVCIQTAPSCPPTFEFNVSHDSEWIVLGAIGPKDKGAQRIGVDVMRVAVPWEDETVDGFIAGLAEQVRVLERFSRRARKLIHSSCSSPRRRWAGYEQPTPKCPGCSVRSPCGR